MGYRVTVERTDDGGFIARNGRGAEVRFASGTDEFSPVELLLAAVGGCNIVTVEPLTAQRNHRLTRLAAVIEAEKVRPNKLGEILMSYDVELPEGDDEAEGVFHGVAERVHDRYCTVTTSLQESTPVRMSFTPAAAAPPSKA